MNVPTEKTTIERIAETAGGLVFASIVVMAIAGAVWVCSMALTAFRGTLCH